MKLQNGVDVKGYTKHWRVWNSGVQGTMLVRQGGVKLTKAEKKMYKKQRTRDALVAQGLL